MDYETLAISRQGSVAWVNLNQPQIGNAMNRQMVADLLDYFTTIQDDRSIRVVVLGGNGPSFCAGDDVREIHANLENRREIQLRYVRRFDEMLTAVNRASQVTIAQVHGQVFGGGVGLVCVSDIAVATESASLALREVRLGLAPAIISPYVIARVGRGAARRLMLTGARLTGWEAVRAGLVTTACPADKLDSHIKTIVNQVLKASPTSLAACKQLLHEVSEKPPSETATYRADLLNHLRNSAEGQEGMAAFMEDRSPAWQEEI